MGYTHYFTFIKTKQKASEVEKIYQQAIKECHKVVLYAKKELDISLSGYTAQT